ncbi:LysR family transcriptional regulator [uncultured Tateyamaria sp.]|uniref:LysR family transcriptional regulator n=1 Tax=uncultured Tateyamaria sp. TaxID=455651 RepID=UPI00261473C1|nr:LysR family transcriptional regulator [uncultured Tateyamaria sp.]
MQNRIGQSFDWNRMRAFLATAEEGSLSGAARHLGLTQPTLGRQVAALEEELGLALFQRTTRAMQLTDAGRDLLNEARNMGEAATRIALMAQGRAQSLDGVIKVTASDMMSAYVLPDIMMRLRSMAPNLRVDVVAANDIRDILKREADIAIRHVRPEQPDLIARLVKDATGHLYASKDYIAARGAPETVEDLLDHDFISFGDDARFIEALGMQGIHVTSAHMRAGSTSGVTNWELLRRGFGILPMSDDIAAQFTDVVRVLPDRPAITFPVWLVTHRELHTSRRIRLAFDLIADMLAER